jgi:hypothetical protein
MKISPDGAEMFHTDGRTDTQTTLIFAFRNFANAPEKWYVVSRWTN